METMHMSQIPTGIETQIRVKMRSILHGSLRRRHR